MADLPRLARDVPQPDRRRAAGPSPGLLAQSEHGFISRVAAAWQQIAGLFGYRVRPGLGSTFETVATLVSASVRGLIIMALSTPDIAGQRTSAQPFGAAEAADWSLPSLCIAGIATAFLEPDPTLTWDANRVAAIQTAMDSLTIPGPSAV